MTSILVRILLVILGILLVQRLLALLFGTHLRRQVNPGSQKPGGKDSKRMVKDPVCGMYMDPRLALQLENKRGAFYFCSEECRSKWLSKPR